MNLSLAENTRAKSDAFAVQNSLPKFDYVLHPRTTGFTFIVERLRKGQQLFLKKIHDSDRLTMKIFLLADSNLGTKYISRTQQSVIMREIFY